ncbi:hypothetical protein K2Z84_13235 [Candidatus Binatia bacterium]|nr:hypothetical protein [Candidatus Binatia bacterium]
MRIGLVAVVGLSVSVAFGAATAAHAAATPAQKCAAAKLKAAGTRAAAKLNCHAKAALKGISVDTDCLAKADAKFATAFSKAEAGGGCIVNGDAGSTGSQVDGMVSNVVAATPSVSYPLSCFDGIKNGFETGVDCGGPCPPCP